MKEKASGHKASPLPWHTAFCQAIQVELYDYRDSLEYTSEYQLTAEPLRIDLLIIKKPKGLSIDKNIARIFRNVNLIEYKSPDDYLSVNDFMKVCAYANLYAAITPKADLADLTITFIESRRPRKLLRYLEKERGYAISETAPGIYQISGDYIPIQIIVSKRLAESENLWLKSLAKDLEVESANAILEARGKSAGKAPMGAYLDLLARANPDIFLEVQTMAAKTRPRRTFEEVFTEAGIIPEWISRGRVEGEMRGKMEIARNLLAKGMPIGEIAQVTALPPEEIQALCSS